MNKREKRRLNRMLRINSNYMIPKIVFIDNNGNQLNLLITDIRRYRAMNQSKDKTLIEMNSGVEHIVIEAFQDVDTLIDSKLNP